ncbi:MAG: chromosomal replication initiator protein DnaA [Sphingobium sp.]|jgi:chromosomal replication initiator protein|uniref:Chromosomal replication initiator protein DnaA n=1 Tax=Sphingobium xenophagum TaxID=121428 RepID=A0A401IYM3_SPHXE|nr:MULTISPECIES: chromosomal replication initiator protein DnaA [Sphingobium]MBU0660348.1 chromosomal replication initiator protein DnaA [Alphaproteobacteria bacterium]MBA4754113.1 chromosomal replication initiator protein DnaA [Sphingobium sp.]MBG6119207.1 chromosomal replication initiator protein [Sphingobium sp. JAI105]MBS89079.1 chromosomal replication initiator protein DnaA [Sphingobium sp.]MBU0868552.1 chromosomal replication initiator protein DnaA [Alphaproteobacteria bacterium]
MKDHALVTAWEDGEGRQADSGLEAAWAAIRAGLRRDIGARMFDQWLKPVRLGDYCPESQTLDLLVATDFSANFVSGQFGDRLRMAWRAANVGVREVRLHRAADATGPRLLEVVRVEPTVAPAPQPVASNFQPRHAFADFVTGDSNRLACSAALAMAGEAEPRFSPLFIHGGTGQGKTHLLHAIARAFSDHSPAAPVLYMSAERFMVEFVNAMRANETMAFKAKLRAARLLLIDDIQFIAGKGSTQEEFLHTINDLIDSGARIVVTADRPPQRLESIDARILSRLAGGLVADILPADLDLRLAILEAKRAVAGDPPVPDAVIDFLARSIRSNVRELEGAFNKLVAYGQLTGRAIDLDFAQGMLADAVRANARRITVDEIQKLCAAHYKIDASEMRSKRRARAVARPRQVAMYLAKKMTPRSLPEIGRIFGGRDHSTVIHAVRTIEGLRESNPDIDADVRALLRQLEG